MNPYMIRAFRDELEGIYKEAGFMQNVGQKIVHTARRADRGLDQISSNVVNGVSSLGGGKAALKKGWDFTKNDILSMKRGGMMSKAMLGLWALGTVDGVRQVAKKEDPSGEGRSRLARGIQFGAEQVGGVMSAPYGLSGGMAGSMMAGYLGGKVGKGVDRLTGHAQRMQKLRAQQAQPTSQPAGAQAPPAAMPPVQTAPAGYTG